MAELSFLRWRRGLSRSRRGFTAIGLIVAVPVAVSALGLMFAGLETRARGLEELAPTGATEGIIPCCFSILSYMARAGPCA